MKIIINTVTPNLQHYLIVLEVEPTDLVKEKLALYALDLGDQQSNHLQPVFFVGQNIPLDEERTFAQCAIKRGDRLHALVQVQGHHIFIENVITKERSSLEVLPTATVAELKKMILQNQFPSTLKYNNIPPGQLMLKWNDTLLEDEKMFKDYHIPENSTLELYPKYHTCFVHLGWEFKCIKEFVVGQQETIFQVKNRITRYYGYEPLHKFIIRAAVKNSKGNCMYLDLDLFCQLHPLFDMTIFIEKSYKISTYTRKFFFSVADKDKIVDIYKKLEHPDYSKTSETWPQGLNYRMATALLPQIEAQATLLQKRHKHKELTLYVFPQYRRSLRLIGISSCETIEQVKAAVCESEGINKANWFLQGSGTPPLADKRFVYEYCMEFGSNKYLTLMRIQQKWRGMISVHVRISDNLTPRIFLHEPNDTIRSVKDMIQHTLVIPRCMQKLYSVCGELIKDECSLNEFEMKDHVFEVYLYVDKITK